MAKYIVWVLITNAALFGVFYLVGQKKGLNTRVFWYIAGVSLLISTLFPIMLGLMNWVLVVLMLIGFIFVCAYIITIAALNTSAATYLTDGMEEVAATQELPPEDKKIEAEGVEDIVAEDEEEAEDTKQAEETGDDAGAKMQYDATKETEQDGAGEINTSEEISGTASHEEPEEPGILSIEVPERYNEVYYESNEYKEVEGTEEETDLFSVTDQENIAEQAVSIPEQEETFFPEDSGTGEAFAQGLEFAVYTETENQLQGEPDMSEDKTKDAVQVDTGDLLNDYISKGFDAKMQGKLDLAVKYFESALELNPSQSLRFLIITDMCAMFKELGQYKKAREALQVFLNTVGTNIKQDMKRDILCEIKHLELLMEMLQKANTPNLPISMVPNLIKVTVEERLGQWKAETF